MFPYHILVTLDRNYLKVLSVMLYSLSPCLLYTSPSPRDA